MRIFFVGDVVGKPGRKLLAEQLPLIRERFRFDVAIANGENAAGGNGLTKNMADELFRAGIDAITMGDHVWDQRCFENEIGSIEKLCRPANIHPSNPGREYVIVEKNGVKLGVFNLLGQTLVKIKSDCPFVGADRVLEELSPKCDLIFLDFHAETSSEKISMGWHLDGRVHAIVGTHTHIPTNDARIFPKGCAFLSDAGMTGPWNSCLGRKWEPILQRFIDGRPRAFSMAEGDNRLCGCLIEIDEKTKRATRVEPYIYPAFPNTTALWERAREEEKLEGFGNSAEESHI